MSRNLTWKQLMAVLGAFGVGIGVGVLIVVGGLSVIPIDTVSISAQQALIDYKCYVIQGKEKLGETFDLTHQNPAVPREKKVEKGVVVGEAQLLCMPVTKARAGAAPAKPDLVPVPAPNIPGPNGFCKKTKDGKQLIVTVRNQGTAAAPASITIVGFSPGGSAPPSPTLALPAGASTDLVFDIPASCSNPDCNFKITVDSTNTVDESNEANNTAEGLCVG